MRFIFSKIFIVLMVCSSAKAIAQKIDKIETRGNKKIESRAITGIRSTQLGNQLDLKKIQQDIRALYNLGYFSDISFFTKHSDSVFTLIIDVNEKPTISEIKFDGKSVPVHEYEFCKGCGICAKVCPVNAIRMELVQ